MTDGEISSAFSYFWNGNPDKGWRRYPRRSDPDETRKQLEIALESETIETIMEGVQASLAAEWDAMIAEDPRQIRYIRKSANWIKQKGWMDHEPQQEGLSVEQVEYWQNALAAGGRVPEGIKRLLPSNVVELKRSG